MLPSFFRKKSKPLVLPPKALRKGGREQRNDDRVYVQKAEALAASVAWLYNLANGGLTAATEDDPLGVKLRIPDDLRILDVGCGPMRLLTGLRSLGVRYAEYVGIDVDAACIDWANDSLSSGRERFVFIDVENERYNPSGKVTDQIELPCEPASFDLITLRSVFTHMRLRHIELYVQELARLPKPTGHIYTSIYAEDGAPLEAENPPGYKEERSASKGPLHRVLINRQHFEQVVSDNGLSVRAFCASIMGQPTYLLAPRSQGNAGHSTP